MTESRILTEYAETATRGTPARRLDGLTVETATRGNASRRLETLAVETATRGAAQRRLATSYVEVLSPSHTVHLNRLEAGRWKTYIGVPKVCVGGMWVVKRPMRWDAASSKWEYMT